jgi:hypothetical protein
MANQVVYGIVGNRAKAEQLIQSIVELGVNAQDISFLSSQGEEFSEFQSTTMTTPESARNWRTEERITDYPAGTMPGGMHGNASTSHARQHQQHKGGLGTEKHTKAPEGTTTGAVTGGIIGGTLGLLAGLGALAIPGLGPFVAAGPIMAALAGIGSGGTLGGIIGALVGLGIPEYEAKRYENRLKEGGILLAVRANDDNLAKKIKDTLQKNGAEDVSTSSEARTSKNYNK